jgi:hypothetical protein
MANPWLTHSGCAARILCGYNARHATSQPITAARFEHLDQQMPLPPFVCQPQGLTTSSPPARHQLATSSPPARHQLATSSPPARHQLATSSPPARHQRATSSPPADALPVFRSAAEAAACGGWVCYLLSGRAHHPPTALPQQLTRGGPLAVFEERQGCWGRAVRDACDTESIIILSAQY